MDKIVAKGIKKIMGAGEKIAPVKSLKLTDNPSDSKSSCCLSTNIKRR